MSILTANTLFHFTGNDPERGKDALLNILGSGFRPSYCSEFGDEAIGGVLKGMLIPMVCFCDLPLSKLDKHINGYEWEYNGKQYTSNGYGQYGLGMSKTWGKNNRLNPVTYINSGSYLLQSAGTAVNRLFSLFEESTQRWNDEISKGSKGYSGKIEVKDDGLLEIDTPGLSFPSMMPESFVKMDQLTNALSNTLAVLAYMKPYQDFTTNQLYYDEREWRYTIPYTRQYKGDVPILTKKNEQYIPLFQGHSKGYDIEDYRKIIASDYLLKFNSEDIKYIIVKNDRDISDVMTRLDELVETKLYTTGDADRLYSRILTYQQIHEDF